jgi:hypothetical protein
VLAATHAHHLFRQPTLLADEMNDGHRVFLTHWLTKHMMGNGCY